MKFLIVIPTVRQELPGFQEVMEHIRGSFTHPTELHVLDGKPNKPETLNRAYDELLAPSDCDVYVTMDDDYLPGKNWQDTVANGMSALPEVGAFAIWLGESEEMLGYMGVNHIGSEQERTGVRYRPIRPPHHIAGAMIAFRRESALAVGKQPPSELNYQIWEDAWRGRRVRKSGKELAYLTGEEIPKIFPYVDPPDYVEDKMRDLEAGLPQVEEYFRKGGIQDPLGVRIARFPRRVAGKLRRMIRGG